LLPGSVTFEAIESPKVFKSTTQNDIKSAMSVQKDWGAFQFVKAGQ
jgi:hypothetical protein